MCGWIVAALVLFLSCAGATPKGPAEPEPDPEFMRSNRAARVAFENGQISQAIALYGTALKRAYINDDTDAIVDARYNLAVCHLQQGTYDEALENLYRAGAELRAAGRRTPPELQLLEAMIRYRNDESDTAWAITDRLLAETPPIAADTMAGARYIRGRIAADRGDIRQLREEIDNLGESMIPRQQADRMELAGRLALLEGRWTEAVNVLDIAARKRSETRDYRSMASILAASAGACEQEGRLEAAAYRYLRAARSAFLNGDIKRAEAWIQETLRLADRAGASDIGAEARDYLRLVNRE
jgi:tetratricopeptide (TPR) repeat protein